MTMAVKYQLSLVSKPKEIILVTLNHLDSIEPFVSHSSSCIQLIENCYKRLFKVKIKKNLKNSVSILNYICANYFNRLI